MRAWAVFKKEMRLYFVSPIAYVVLASFALIAGWFFYNVFAFYALVSMQAAMNPMMARDMSVTEGVLRPLFQNISVIMLLMMPILTMRLFAEEKKSGTIELLLTYPFPDAAVDGMKGDYTNLYADLDLNLGTILDNLGRSRQSPLDGVIPSQGTPLPLPNIPLPGQGNGSGLGDLLGGLLGGGRK